jgi:ferredoxin-NADP reductase
MAEKIARFGSRRTLAPGVHVYSLVAEVPPTLEYRPGQFISIRCEPSGDVRRSYTLISPPGAGLDLLVKDVDGGVGTAFLQGLAPGDAVHFTGPMGFFVADPAHAADVVHVVTGAGIAASLPVLAETLARAGESGQVALLWGQLDGQPLYWRERLQALPQARFTATFISAATWPEVHAQLASAATARIGPGSIFYTVGNGDMCRRVRDALVGAGVDRRQQIRNEIFYPVMEGQK